MPAKVTTFLMFEGKAEEAMKFYTTVFDRSEIVRIDRYAAGEGGPEGSVKLAEFRILGQTFLCIDSPVKHGFTFTPAMSLFVESERQKEIDEAFARLSEGGQVLMPLAEYPFSKKFGWLNDRFGVSWQLKLN